MRKYTFFIVSLLIVGLLNAKAQNGVIKTIAGTSAIGYGGDGGPAILATLDTPHDVAVDQSGNVFFIDDNRVRKINTLGIVSTIAGNGTAGYSGDGTSATTAQLNWPKGLAIDAGGNIYIADYNNNRIRRVSTTGIINTIAGTGSGGYSGDGGPATLAVLNHPFSLAVDAAGNIFISDLFNDRIRKVNSTGLISTIAGNGIHGFSGDGGPATSAKIAWGKGIVVDNTGNLYIADNNNSRIRKVNTSGIISTFAGNGGSGILGDGKQATAASLGNPIALAFDKFGNLFIGGVLIRKVNNADGKIVTVAGAGFSSLTGDGGYSYTSSFDLRGIALDTFNNIYIADYRNHRIRKISQFAEVHFYFDGNNNCIQNTNESLTHRPVTVQVDSNGIIIDTVSCTSGLGYNTNGKPGDIYNFKVVAAEPDLVPGCPSSGIVSDTIQSAVGNFFTKEIGFQCSTTPGFDLKLEKHRRKQTLRVNETTFLRVSNKSCNVQSGVLTVNFSPKYLYSGSTLAPLSVVGNTISWNIPNLSSQNQPIELQYYLEAPISAPLMLGDTVQTYVSIAPTTGDNDISNNAIIIIDTVRASCDPNDIVVSPSGYIPSGIQLEYTIRFENVGNDTAFNIYIMDSLSDYLEPKSFRIISSSAAMNTTMLHNGNKNILKFDFPNINLLDSSHHGECDGMLEFTIKTKNGLPDGTQIFNHAGIYFDNNGVVMTNTVENIIGIPNNVAAINDNKEVLLYPNPANNQLTIKTEQNTYTSFTITNSMGQALAQQAITAAQTNVDIKALVPGLYYVTMKGESGVKTMKFVKMD